MVEDTSCEATELFMVRVVLTADDAQTVEDEARYLSGYSIITTTPLQVCIEGWVAPEHTPDGRPGALLLFNAPCPLGMERFRKAVAERLYILPHLPTCGLFDGWRCEPVLDSVDLSRAIGRWGDGYEVRERVYRRDVMRLPIMSGDMLVECSLRVGKGLDAVIEVFGRDNAACLIGARTATARLVGEATGVGVFNYPLGGISGAKVGGRVYTHEGVSINEPYCPTLRGKATDSCIPPGANAVIEYPMTGLTEEELYAGLSLAIQGFGDTPGIVGITAPRFGGQWGDQHLSLRRALELIQGPPAGSAA